MKLVQKQFLKGTREFEIVEDMVSVRIKSIFKEETITVVLSVLNPEPVVNAPFLEFHSRVKCGPLLSLMINKPNAREYDAFVSELKQRVRQEYNAFAGLKAGSEPKGLNGNVYEEPSEFGDSGKNLNKKNLKPVRVNDVDQSILMLNQYVSSEEIKPLLAVLEALKEDPENESSFEQLAKAFDDLGSQQGAVLTYAPYVGILLSDDPFGY